MVFRSKVDVWLALLLTASGAVALLGAKTAWASGAGWLIAAVVALLGAALPMWVLLSTRYTVAGGLLLIQCGPLRWRIQLLDITQIVPTRSPLSSPALSLDRLRIGYGNGRKFVMVSPADRDAFLRAIDMAKNKAG